MTSPWKITCPLSSQRTGTEILCTKIKNKDTKLLAHALDKNVLHGISGNE